jgi:hypothetical protein
LILAVAGGLFAQEVSFSGIVETGVRIQKKDDEAGRVDIHNDNDDVRSRARIQGTYDAETYGAKVGIGTDLGDNAEKFVEIYNAYAWYNFLNDIINVKAGLIDDAVWNTGGTEDWDLSNGVGVRVEVKPIEGLNVGFFLTNSAGNTFGDDVAGDFLKETGIGASYTSALFDLAVAFKLDSEVDGIAIPDKAVDFLYGYLSGWGVYGGNKEDFKDDLAGSAGAGIMGDDADAGIEAIFGFAFKGLPALTAKAEGHAYNLGQFSDFGFLWLNEDVGYQILDPLKAGVVFTQVFFVGDFKNDVEIDPYLVFKPYVEYQINEPILVGLEAPIGLQDDVLDFELGIKPWVKYLFNENAYIKAFYKLDYTDPKGSADATTDHTIQLDFVVSF